MSVLENVAYGLSVTGVAKEETRARAERGLEMVHLAGEGTRRLVFPAGGSPLLGLQAGFLPASGQRSPRPPPRIRGHKLS